MVCTIGGAIYVGQSGTIAVTGSTFSNCTSYLGGAIYIHVQSRAIISSSIFDGNIAADGGAIKLLSYSPNSTQIDVTNSLFRWNTATDKCGGAVNVDSRAVGNFESSTFLYNSVLRITQSIMSFFPHGALSLLL